MTAPPAIALAREPLKGGGGVLMPAPYKVRTAYPNYAARSPDALIGYRNWRSTMSGHPECDGMLAAGLATSFGDLTAFVQHAHAALSIQWGDADRIPGQPWDGKETRYRLEQGQGPSGPELTQQLAVHRVGVFNVYDQAAHLCAVAHKRGVHVAVWIYDNQGGLKAARKLADKVAASFEA